MMKSIVEEKLDSFKVLEQKIFNYAMAVTESPCRVTADIISSTCGQSISAGGVWNVMQRSGERISGEEEHAVKQMEADRTEGERESVCGCSESPHADHGGSADGIRESI